MLIRINRETLLKDMLEYREVFDKLMQNIEDRGSRGEFETRLYRRLYHDVICESADNMQKERMSIQSLSDNGMFVHSNPNSGTTAIQPAIIKIFRFISEKKSVAMSHAGFSRIRAGFEGLQKEMLAHGSINDDHYRLSMEEFQSFVTDTIGEVKQSIDALKQAVVSLSEVYRLMQEQGSSYESDTKLLEKVSYLHNNFAIPCYQFIDEDVVLDDGLSVTQSIKRVIDFHDQHGASDVSLSLKYDLNKIASFYKDIEGLVSQLNAYSQYLSQSRQKYMAIDAAFESMMVDIRALRHGRKNNAKFTPGSSFLENFRMFDGISSRPMYQQRLNWIENVTLLRFSEWLRSNIGEERAVNPQLLKSIHTQESPSERRKINVSMNVMSKMKLPAEGVEDVVVFIHEWLKSHQKDYRFIDVLTGIQAFYGMHSKVTLNNTTERRKLVYDGYYLNYLNVSTRRKTA